MTGVGYARSKAEPRQSPSPNRFLPANSFISASAFGTPCPIQVDKVNHDLLWSKILGKLLFARRLVAQDHNFRGAQHAFEVGGEHGSDMRNHFFDVLTIGTGQAAERDIFIPDFDFEALAQ